MALFGMDDELALLAPLLRPTRAGGDLCVQQGGHPHPIAAGHWIRRMVRVSGAFLPAARAIHSSLASWSMNASPAG